MLGWQVKWLLTDHFLGELRLFLEANHSIGYLHQGESYLVTDLDLANRTAYAEPTTASYYTQTKEIEDLRIV
ncbi:unnamed protein product, partial [marine sediment metagenome]